MTVTSRWVCFLIAAACTLQVTAPAMAKGSAESGAAKTATCVACHGPGGNSVNPMWPNLAGQNAVYIEKQLHHFHAGTRMGYDATSMMMPPMAATLSDQDIEDVAAYFSSQTPTGGEANAQYWEAGRKLFHGGDRERGIPACAACHGPLGSGNPAAGYPQLRAQHSEYTVRQLAAYKAGTRYSVDAKGNSNGGDNAAIMQSIVQRLSADDVRNLAAYVEGMR